MHANEQGADFSRYTFIPRTLIFIFRENYVLLLKGANTKRLWGGRYNGIGGHIEKGEDIITSAYRELREETGLTSPQLFLCGVLSIDTGINPGVFVFIFKGECTETSLGITREGSLHWVEISEIDNLPVVPDLPLLLPKILAFSPGSEIFYAHTLYDENGQHQLEINKYFRNK
jgi:8-oxo-dGTP diphosphatase